MAPVDPRFDAIRSALREVFPNDIPGQTFSTGHGPGQFTDALARKIVSEVPPGGESVVLQALKNGVRPERAIQVANQMVTQMPTGEVLRPGMMSQLLDDHSQGGSRSPSFMQTRELSHAADRAEMEGLAAERAYMQRLHGEIGAHNANLAEKAAMEVAPKPTKYAARSAKAGREGFKSFYQKRRYSDALQGRLDPMQVRQLGNQLPYPQARDMYNLLAPADSNLPAVMAGGGGAGGRIPPRVGNALMSSGPGGMPAPGLPGGVGAPGSANLPVPAEWPTRVLPGAVDELPGMRAIGAGASESIGAGAASTPRTIFNAARLAEEAAVPSTPRTIFKAIETRELPAGASRAAQVGGNIIDDVGAAAVGGAEGGMFGGLGARLAGSRVGQFAVAHPTAANIAGGLAIDIGSNMAGSALDSKNIGGEGSNWDEAIPGAVRGAGVGAGIGLLAGPFAPVSVPVAAGVGAGIGAVANVAKNLLGDRDSKADKFNKDVDKNWQKLATLAASYGLDTSQLAQLRSAYDKDVQYQLTIDSKNPDRDWFKTALPSYMGQLNTITQQGSYLNEASQRSLALQASIGKYTDRTNADAARSTTQAAAKYRGLGMETEAANAEYYGNRYQNQWANAMQLLPQMSNVKAMQDYNTAHGLDPTKYATIQPTFATQTVPVQ